MPPGLRSNAVDQLTRLVATIIAQEIGSMPSEPSNRGAELRERLKNAHNNETILLPLREKDYGEYRGPFIIDKPVTLIGCNEQTPLFATGCPSLVVLSPGVKLENLDLSDTFDPSAGVCLLLEENSHPVLNHVTKNGRDLTMTRDHLIDLGEFLPHQEGASSWIELEVSGPSKITYGENCLHWLKISPTEQIAAGKFRLQFEISKSLGPDDFALGSFEITTGPAVNEYWVIAHALPAIPPRLLRGPIELWIGKDHRVLFSDGLVLGKNLFPERPDDGSIPDCQAVIQKEGANGGWAVYQLNKTPTSTIVDGHPIQPGQHALLQEGSLIQIDHVDLKVGTFKAPADFSVDKPLVDFGPTDAPFPDLAFTIQFHGQGVGKIHAVSTVPWLDVKPTELEFAKDEIKKIATSFTPEIANLPQARHLIRSAVLIRCGQETISLDASVLVKPDMVIPRTNIERLEFGTVTDWTDGHIKITVYNDGTKGWQASAKVDQDWITLAQQGLSIPPGKSATLSLWTNKKIENLTSPGEQAAKLVLVGDGIRVTREISARIQLKEANPVLETPVLELNSIAGEMCCTAPIMVSNSGTKDWNALIKPAVDWLDILGEDCLFVPAGGQNVILVQINSKAPTEDQNVPGAVLIEGKRHTLSVGVKTSLVHSAKST